MADENLKELEQEQDVTDAVDEGAPESDAGTGMIAEEQETAAAADEQPAASEMEDPVAVTEEQSFPPMPSAPVEEAQPKADLHEKTGSGIDMAVIIVVLLIVIAGISYAIWDASNASAPQTVAQQQAEQAAKAQAKEPPFEVVELPEGVAAIVNGEEILESTVTDYIAEFREIYNLTSDEAWSQWMATMGYTPETVRYETVQMFVNDALERQAIADMGIEVTDEDVNEVYDQMRANYESDEEWERALKDEGLTEEEFREQCVEQAQENALAERLGDEATTPEEIDAQTLEYIKTYYTEYADATSLDQIDEEIVTPVREMLKYYADQQAYTDFMTTQRAEGDIVMSAMPENLPYNENSLTYFFDTLAAQFQIGQQQQQQQQ